MLAKYVHHENHAKDLDTLLEQSHKQDINTT